LGRAVNIASFYAEIAVMKKSRQLPVFAWLVGAALAAAALSSCAPQAQTCSAYQQVQPVTR